MCEFVGNKIVFSDGTEISLDSFVMENLTPNQIKSLNESAASKYDILIIRKNLHSLRNDIHKIINDNELKCKGYAEQIEQIKNKGKKNWQTFIGYTKDIAVLIGILYYVIQTIK